MHQDERMDAAGEPPFDAKRLILGCVQPVFSMGRDRAPLTELIDATSRAPSLIWKRRTYLVQGLAGWTMAA
jgi:hypothetical protein